MQFEISLAKKRGTSDFVARGQLHCEFTASSARLSKERAGWQASTFKHKVANIKLTPLRQAPSLFCCVVCFCLLFFLLCYQRACLTSTTTLFGLLFLKHRMWIPPCTSPACALFSAAVTTAASLIRRGRACGRREVKGTQARFSGQGRRDGSGDDWWIIQKAVVLPLALVEMFPLN